tara:strand:+ start:423 stop:656 length:234 start_codon:yes stop_codon:yes gene_type:complete
MIYRLRYKNKEEALQDLKNENVIDQDCLYINGTEAVVFCDIETLENYCFCNIMTNDKIVFDSEIFPINEKFKFGGHE